MLSFYWNTLIFIISYLIYIYFNSILIVSDISNDIMVFKWKMTFFLISAKLLSRSQKIAYALLNKVGSIRDNNAISQGDRVCFLVFMTYPWNPWRKKCFYGQGFTRKYHRFHWYCINDLCHLNVATDYLDFKRIRIQQNQFHDISSMHYSLPLFITSIIQLCIISSGCIDVQLWWSSRFYFCFLRLPNCWCCPCSNWSTSEERGMFNLIFKYQFVFLLICLFDNFIYLSDHKFIEERSIYCSCYAHQFENNLKSEDFQTLNLNAKSFIS